MSNSCHGFIAGTLIVAGVLSGGAPVAAVAETAARPVPSQHVLVSVPSTAAWTMLPATGSSAATAPHSAPGAAQHLEQGSFGVVKKIVDFMRTRASQYYDSMRRALQQGYGAFQNWYNSLPGWVQGTITTFWSGTLFELFKALVDYLF